jgi:hypothetical protein
MRIVDSHGKSEMKCEQIVMRGDARELSPFKVIVLKLR